MLLKSFRTSHLRHMLISLQENFQIRKKTDCREPGSQTFNFIKLGRLSYVTAICQRQFTRFFFCDKRAKCDGLQTKHNVLNFVIFTFKPVKHKIIKNYIKCTKTTLTKTNSSKILYYYLMDFGSVRFNRQIGLFIQLIFFLVYYF